MIHFSPTFFHIVNIFTGCLSLSRKGQKTFPPYAALCPRNYPQWSSFHHEAKLCPWEVESQNIILHPLIAKKWAMRGFLLLTSVTSKQRVSIFINWSLRGVNVEQFIEGTEKKSELYLFWAKSIVQQQADWCIWKDYHLYSFSSTLQLMKLKWK